MYPNKFRGRAAAIIVALAVSSVNGSVRAGQNTSAADASGGKIPVTTSSEEARKEFLLGRGLAEKLLAQDSLQHFDKALTLDPNFALAELSRANASGGAKGFFDHLKKAVALSSKVSNGEKLLILASEAGANGNAAKQKEYLEQLVAAYPRDERAHFNAGGYYFGQQDYATAIQHYKKATALAPTYSPAYNILGYAYRQNADYPNAERAFKKYIELIPGDPNPYDSYAELLLKMGRFEESLTQYAKALSIDPNFIASHLGRAADLMYMGKPGDAATELQAISTKARSDGERRIALFGMAVLAVDSGKSDEALGHLDKEYAVAEKANDVAAMSGDLQNKGTVLLEMGRYDEAKAAFDRSLAMTEGSTLSQEIKGNAKLFQHFNLAQVALGKGDSATADAEAQTFSKGVASSGNPAFVRQAHALTGQIALQGKKYDAAIAELEQANQQNPYDLYRLCLAYLGKGNKSKATEMCTAAARFNSLPQLNYAFIRTKAAKMARGPIS
jgi:tetratricopeptide (TPR) repeat protein